MLSQDYFPGKQGSECSEEDPGESIKPKVLLKLKSNQERPQDEAFLRALVRVQMCTHVCVEGGVHMHYYQSGPLCYWFLCDQYTQKDWR